MKYIWLNMETGVFSNSWSEEEHLKYLSDKDIIEGYQKNPEWKLIEWKLIQYQCINEPTFDLYNRMKIVDISHDKNNQSIGRGLRKK